MIDGSDALTRIVVRLYDAFGPDYVDGAEVQRFVADEDVYRGLLQCGYLVSRNDRVALSARSLRLAFTTAREVTADETIQAIEDQKLEVVTRRFLEEVLVEAAIPAELMDLVVATYQVEGELTMSEDGGRYIIHLHPRAAAGR